MEISPDLGGKIFLGGGGGGRKVFLNRILKDSKKFAKTSTYFPKFLGVWSGDGKRVGGSLAIGLP